ncbi:hypothetical protein FGF04_27705 [Streptomyces apricus]|uniref:Uncharacterized protein n=1 Tax=Streptomyces apricus TaxID=1828112 RepID=A0A5B0AMY2_9ACTN|nr:hypothetical protein FGF04_27705 [Streptomyces apricus]
MRWAQPVEKLTNVQKPRKSPHDGERKNMTAPVFEEFDPASDCDCPGCAHWRRVLPHSTTTGSRSRSRDRIPRTPERSCSSFRRHAGIFWVSARSSVWSGSRPTTTRTGSWWRDRGTGATGSSR